MKPVSLQKRFTACYEAQNDAIFRFCLIRVSDREKALDITQEAFTRMWQTLIKGTAIDNERAFLYTVSHRLIIDWYRKKKPVSLEGLSDPETQEAYEPIDEQAMENIGLESEGRFLLQSLNKIGSSNREAVYLRFVEGLSPPEIAEILGVNTNAASVRISRGLEELRKITGYDIDK